MNLSLMLNSVGFDQISKLSMIPVVCVMEWILHSKNYWCWCLHCHGCEGQSQKSLCAAVAVLCTSLQQFIRILHPLFLKSMNLPLVFSMTLPKVNGFSVAVQVFFHIYDRP